VRLPHLIVLACLALAGCDRSPAFDTSSLPAYRKSLAEVMANLSAADQRRLELALMMLAVGNDANINVLALANPQSIASLPSFDGVANPLIYLDRLRPRIEGRTAPAVIRLAVADLDEEISRVQSQSGGAEQVLSVISIEQPRYSWDQKRRIPLIDFSVTNSSRSAVSRIRLTGVLKTHVSANPWVIGGLSYTFPNGLQPGEQIHVQLALADIAATSLPAPAALADAEFSLKVTNADISGGRPLLPIDTGTLDAMRKERAILTEG